jgi:two-component system, NtrC family, sensor kinase
MEKTPKTPDVCARPGLPRELSKPIRLTRTFFAMSLIIVALVLAIQSWFYVDWLQSDILENSKNNAVRIAQHLHFQIEAQFRSQLSDSRGTPGDDTKKIENGGQGSIEDFDPNLIDVEKKPELGAFGVLAKEELERLDRLIHRAIAKHGVIDVYIFDRERHITYSTNWADVGFDLKENKYYDLALQGEVSAVLVERGSPVDISQRRFGVVLLETYVPIRSKRDGTLLGIIEIYQDASEITRVAQRGLLHIGLVSIVGFAMLTIGLWFIVDNAHRHLDRRTAALIDTNRELSELSQSLEQQVEERGRQLSRAETLASVGTLAAGVAHEINNPIATIASCAEGLLRKQQKNRAATRDSGARQIQYLELIKEEAYRVKGITRNLLDFSRPSSNQHRIIDLREPLKATMTILEFRAKKAGKLLEFNSSGEETLILGDPNALRQLFLNITINALDASEAEAKVQWHLSKKDATIVACCQDQGLGMNPEQLNKIFDPFYTTKEPGKGTGLGLSISHSIVQQHNGILDIQSQESQGTNVIVTFPYADPHFELTNSKSAGASQ